MDIEAKKDQMQGRTEQAAGDLTSNEDMQARGENRETEGKAKEVADKAKDKVTGAIDGIANKFNK